MLEAFRVRCDRSCACDKAQSPTGARDTIRTVVIAGLAVIATFAPTTVGWTDEMTTQAKASVSGGTIHLLTAPHVGKTVCEIPDRTTLKFIRYARHGPHEFAEVQVLEGLCAGKDGYIPARSMDQPS